jgi:hypothetical protein
MLALTWTTATDVAAAVLAVIVVWLLREVYALERRLTRVEALLERNGLKSRRNG